jgi:hypothetical protein
LIEIVVDPGVPRCTALCTVSTPELSQDIDVDQVDGEFVTT